MTVAVGQIWLVRDVGAGLRRRKIHVQITRIDGSTVHAVLAHSAETQHARDRTYPRSVFDRGLRGAQLEREADGHVPYSARPHARLQPMEDSATASDFVREVKPKVEACSERARRAMQLSDSGASLSDVAAALGVNLRRASTLIRQAREIQEDERNLRELRGGR